MPTQCLAWGPSAHRIIAWIALRNLDPKARLSVDKLLDEKDFIAGSTWADEVRPLRPETASWHFVNMPQNASAFVASRDCPEGQCAVAMIQRFESVLLSKNSKFEEKVEALKFLIHLVGDLHQPLHCGYKEDYFANSKAVVFFGRATNLHSVWDAAMVSKASYDDELSYQKRLLTDYQQLQLEVKSKLSDGFSQWVTVWATESYGIAVSYAYNIDSYSVGPVPTNNKKKKSRVRYFNAASNQWSQAFAASEIQYRVPLTAPVEINDLYYKRNLPVMERQLVKAGVRLAAILNFIFR